LNTRWIVPGGGNSRRNNKTTVVGQLRATFCSEQSTEPEAGWSTHLPIVLLVEHPRFGVRPRGVKARSYWGSVQTTSDNTD